MKNFYFRGRENCVFSLPERADFIFSLNAKNKNIFENFACAKFFKNDKNVMDIFGGFWVKNRSNNEKMVIFGPGPGLVFAGFGEGGGV